MKISPINYANAQMKDNQHFGCVHKRKIIVESVAQPVKKSAKDKLTVFLVDMKQALRIALPGAF